MRKDPQTHILLFILPTHGETTFALSSDTRKTKSEFENWEQGFIIHIR